MEVIVVLLTGAAALTAETANLLRLRERLIEQLRETERRPAEIHAADRMAAVLGVFVAMKADQRDSERAF